MQQMRELIERDRNYACVVMWSVGNEPRSQEPAAGPYFKSIIDLTREMDPTRPVTMVETDSPNATHVSEYCDVVCINRYYGWYWNHGRLDVIEHIADQEIPQWFERFKKPIIITEFGADTIEGNHHLGKGRVNFTGNGCFSCRHAISS